MQFMNRYKILTLLLVSALIISPVAAWEGDYDIDENTVEILNLGFIFSAMYGTLAYFWWDELSSSPPLSYVFSGWDAAKSGTNYAWNAAKSGTNYAWNAAKSGTNYAWNAAKSGANYVWDTSTAENVSYAWDSTKYYANSAWDTTRTRILFCRTCDV